MESALNFTEINRGAIWRQTDARGAALQSPTIAWSTAFAGAEVRIGPEEQSITLCPPAEGQPHSLATVVTPLGKAKRVAASWTDPVTRLRLDWSIDRLLDRSGIVVGARLTNEGDAPVRLRRFVLLDDVDTASPGLRVTGDAAAWWLGTLPHNRRCADLATDLPSADEMTRRKWASFNMPVPVQLGLNERNADGAWRCYRDWATLYRRDDPVGLAIGPVGSPEANLDLAFRVRGNELRLSLSSEMSDVVVAPGESRDAQSIAAVVGPHDEVVTALLNAVAQSHDARLHRGPASGWCSWYHYFDKVTQDDIAGIAGAAMNRDELPLDVIQIDDGWQRTVGDWRCNEKFAGGFAPLIAAIERAGAVPGIWIAPLAVHESTDVFRDHPDWFQHDRHGKLVGEANNWGPKSRWIDPTHPGARAWIRDEMKRLRDAGFRYVKVDFNTIGENVRFHDPSKTAFQALRDLYALYRETLGEDIYLLACIGMHRAVCGYSDGTRIGPDSLATWGGHPCSIEECIRATTTTSLSNGVLWWSDPDVAYAKLRGSLTEHEHRTWIGQVALLGGLAFSSEPFHTPEYAGTAGEFARMLPPARERARPWRGGTDRDGTQIGFVAERPWGRWATGQIHNPGTERAERAIEARGLEPLGPRVFAWSFWDRQWLGEVNVGDLRFTLEAHEPRLLRLTPATDRPTLIGSTLHYAQGAVEVAAWDWTGDQLTIELDRRAGAASGSLWLANAEMLRIAAMSGLSASATVDGPLLRIDVSARERDGVQRIELRH
jgi:hypothetical protein